MKIIRYSLGQMRANCYFLVEGDSCLIVDPGDEADFLTEEIQRQKLQPVAILATHGHFDHVMAVGEIQRSFPIPLYLQEADLFLIKRLNATAQHFLGYNPYCLPPTIIKKLEKGDWEIGNFKLQVITSPGHTPGGCCFYFKDEQVVFTGDTLFKDGIGRYDFSYSNKKDLDESIAKILTLPEGTTIYSGHGDETVIPLSHF